MASRMSAVMVLLLVGICFGAMALTGQGDSPAGTLDTTLPVFLTLKAAPSRAAAGTTPQDTAGRRFGAAMRRALSAYSSASGSPQFSNCCQATSSE